MRILLLIVFLFALSLAPADANPVASDITGTRTFTVSLDGSPQNFPMTFVFKQTGEKLTGTQGENKLTGTVKGNNVTFVVEGKNKSGEPYKNTFNGKVELPTKLTGTCEFPKGPGAWTATRK